MIDGWIIVALSFLYIGGLFGVAYWGDRAGRRQTSLTARPYVYALALGVYCTSWTFFGSVGSAAAKGLDFIAVYLGPIVAFALAAPLLRRIVLLTKTQNITSIADFIAARYGKNPAVAAIVTVVAVVGLLPYIALQLKAISQSIELIFGHPAQGIGVLSFLPVDMALLIALTLAAFAILFGARQTDATEHQRGLMLAIAAELVVKLGAFLAVGAGIVFFMFGGIGPLMAQAAARPEITRLFENGIHGGTLLTVTWLSFVCIFLLPRQFHATFVENVSEEELKKAFWLFPVYLVAINIFVVPVAIAGILKFSGTDVPPDMYLLALPFYSGNHILTFLAFLGGLSAATAMVVMETVALSIMVCNDLLLPLILKRHTAGAEGSGDMSRLLLNIRRASILAIILLAYGLFDSIEKSSLAEIGLLSFAAIAQFAPAFFLGFVWRRATARGALAGILAGFAVWGYTLLLPKLIAGFPDGAAFLKQGPFGLTILRPEMLFYLHFDHLTHGVVWSLFANLLALITVSLLRPLEPIERLQTNIFVEDAPSLPGVPAFRPWRTRIPMNELISTASRYLGEDRAERSFADYMAMRGMDPKELALGDMHALKFTENLLASAIGAPSSRLVMSLMLRRLNVGRELALRLLDEASEAVQYNRDLLQTALEHVGQGLAVFDKKMQLICWNRQFREILMLPAQYGRVGAPLDEIVRCMAQRVHESPAAVEELVAGRIAQYQVTMETFHERSIEGRVVEVRTNAMPLGGIVVTYTDITEREAAAEALARANEHLERRVQARTQELAIAKAKADEANLSKTRFLAAASHDVLQPLNAARLYAASLLERSPPAEMGRLARNIDASLDGVEEILTALLDISKLDSGAMKPDFAVFPINELLDQLRIDFEPIAKSRGIALSIVQSLLAGPLGPEAPAPDSAKPHLQRAEIQQGKGARGAGLQASRQDAVGRGARHRAGHRRPPARIGVQGISAPGRQQPRRARHRARPFHRGSHVQGAGPRAGSQIGARPWLGVFGVPANGALAGPGAAPALQHAASALRKPARRHRALPRQRPQHHRRHEHLARQLALPGHHRARQRAGHREAGGVQDRPRHHHLGLPSGPGEWARSHPGHLRGLPCAHPGHHRDGGRRAGGPPLGAAGWARIFA